jgi:hypothetical protein
MKKKKKKKKKKKNRSRIYDLGVVPTRGNNLLTAPNVYVGDIPIRRVREKKAL